MRKASCDGVNGWLEPDYSSILVSYNEVDVLCDNQDNDCDGVIDEGGVERCRDGVDNDCDGTVDEPECSAFCGDGFADLEGVRSVIVVRVIAMLMPMLVAVIADWLTVAMGLLMRMRAVTMAIPRPNNVYMVREYIPRTCM